ncbi:BRCT domain-containing protein [Glaesserella parasuis]|nr:BRCT domain-containing protein [Glaesserella parasuis]
MGIFSFLFNSEDKTKILDLENSLFLKNELITKLNIEREELKKELTFSKKQIDYVREQRDKYKTQVDKMKNKITELEYENQYLLNQRDEELGDKMQSDLSIFEGKKLFFIGDFSKHSTQKCKDIAIGLGASVSVRLSSKVDYVFVADNHKPEKVEEAKLWGIKILSEDDFYQLIDTSDNLIKDISSKGLSHIVYMSSHKDVNAYTLSNASDDGFYIRAYCEQKSKIITLRHDRIISTFDNYQEADNYARNLPNNIYNLFDERINSQRHQTNQTHSHTLRNNITFCFSGFKKERKEELTNLAIENDLRVVTSISKFVNYLVIDSTSATVGPTKLAKAEQFGIQILNEQEFLNLLETGEIPD